MGGRKRKQRAKRRSNKANLRSTTKYWGNTEIEINEINKRFLSEIESIIEYSQQIGDLIVDRNSVLAYRNTLRLDSPDYLRRSLDLEGYTLNILLLRYKRDKEYPFLK